MSTPRPDSLGSVVIANDNSPAGTVTDRDPTTRVLAEETASADQTAADVMSTDLCAVAPMLTLRTSAGDERERVRCLPVCDESDEFVGIITADDLTGPLADENQQLASVIQTRRPEY